MADSIFDNRYRYDYIYPRGRSGETLRAVDLSEGERPVVIKRPAPQDAPPIRSGQEVSILNERKALMRLAGHPSMTALLGGGQFSVSGVLHQYIVMERADGDIIADSVLELDKRGERLPELEMLVIVDNLLDLLNAAHNQDIVYNDVDAKHLFWNRAAYQLKVIDWGNTVFLDGDEITAQGISRLSDIYQVGELLYFVLTGGARMDAPRDAGDNFRLSFGHDAERVHSRLQALVSRAAHPNPRLRYKTILELRKDLTDYRAPLERERNALIGRVNERLRRDLSKSDLIGLQRTLEPALAADPGYPATRQALTEIENRLSDIEVSADLDAARIYMSSSNWGRAANLLEELKPRARGNTASLIDLLGNWAATLRDQRTQIPAAVPDAVNFAFAGEPDQAVRALLTRDIKDVNGRGLQYLLADALAARLPDVILLRPPLHRLSTSLAALNASGVIVTELRVLLREIDTELNALSSVTDANLIRLRDGYRSVVDQLTAFGTLLETITAEQAAPMLNPLERANNAAMALADNMHVIGKQAATAPRDALAALDTSRVIDPTNPSWEVIGALLGRLYEMLGRYQTYVPNADGSDLENWLTATRGELIPYNERTFDEMLAGMVSGLEIAGRDWRGYAAAAVQGNRIGAVTALAQAIEAVGTVSPTLSGWLNQLRTVISNASYIERHALYGGLGRALADGWEHFDRGRLIESERLGGTAFEATRDDAERFSARRLRELASLAREWTDRSSASSAERTDAALTMNESLYTADELAMRDSFNAQMPSKDTFLKAMNKGLVELFARRSTAAVRILFVNYILLGALDAQEDRLDDAAFWRDAAVRVLGESSVKHPLVRSLEEVIQRRRDLLAAADLINAINGARALATLDQSRKALDENGQAKLLAAGVYSLRELEAALRDWSDGEFRVSGIKLENALKSIDEIESSAQITLTAYRAFLMELVGKSAELHTNARKMSQIVESRPDFAPESLLATHDQQVQFTSRLIGETYAANLRQWHDTYESFLTVYTDRTMRRSAKLARFNDLFGAMFIDRHPAYPLYRAWFTQTEQASEFPAPPTSDPTPRVTDDALNAEPPDPTLPRRRADDQAAPRRRSPVIYVVLLIGLVLVIGGIVLGSGVLNGGSGTPTPSALAAITDEPTARVAAITEETNATVTRAIDITDEVQPSPTTLAILNTLPARPTDTITNTPTRTRTATRTATVTDTPTITRTATFTPTLTFTPFPTPPVNGVLGEQDMLTFVAGIDPFWDSEYFSFQIEDNLSFWRLGSGALAGDGIVLIQPPADLLNVRYGNDAPTRIVRVEATISLITYNPPLLVDDEIYFGVLLQQGENPADVAGVQLNLVEPGILNLGQRIGGTVDVVGQRAYTIGNPLRIRLERNFANENIIVYVENTPVGQPIPFAGGDIAVFPALYVHEGGVIVHVSEWTITLV